MSVQRSISGRIIIFHSDLPDIYTVPGHVCWRIKNQSHTNYSRFSYTTTNNMARVPRTQRRALTDLQKRKIVALLNAGISYAEIARQTTIPERTTPHSCERYRERETHK